MFLVVHAPEICRAVADHLVAFVSSLIPSLTQEFRTILLVSLAVPGTPDSSPLFQRPPPLFS
jgi:hypothetical protein